MGNTKKSAYKKAVRRMKWAWVALEVKGGWRLKLVIGPLNFYPKPSRLFKTIEACENFANAFDIKEGNIVFVHLANSKFKLK